MNHVTALTAEGRHANLDLDQLRQLIGLVEYDVTDAPRVPRGIRYRAGPVMSLHGVLGVVADWI